MNEKNKTQVKLAQKGFQQIRELIDKFQLFWSIDFENPQVKNITILLNKKYKFDLDEAKFNKRFERVRKEKARELLENPGVDFQMYMHVID